MVKKSEIEEISYKLGQITSDLTNLNEKLDRMKKCFENFASKYDKKIDSLEKNGIRFNGRIKKLEEIKIDERLKRLENSHYQLAKELLKSPKTLGLIIGGVLTEMCIVLKTFGVI